MQTQTLLIKEHALSLKINKNSEIQLSVHALDTSSLTFLFIGKKYIFYLIGYGLALFSILFLCHKIIRLL